MNSNYPYWTWPKRIPPPTINNSLYFLYWLLLREFSAVMQQNKTLFSFISFVVAVDYYVESLCDTVFHRCSEVATSIFQLYYHSLVTSVQALKWNHSVTDHLTSKQVQCDHWAHIKQGSTFQLPERPSTAVFQSDLSLFRHRDMEAVLGHTKMLQEHEG